MRETSFVSTTVGAADSLTCFCYGVPLPAEAVWNKNEVPVSASSAKPITNTQECSFVIADLKLVKTIYSQIRFIATYREETKSAQNVAIIRMLQ